MEYRIIEDTDHTNVGELLLGWLGSADIDDEGAILSMVDPNNEDAVKERIRLDLLKNYNSYDDQRKKYARKGLRYLLSVDANEIENQYNGCMIALQLPDDPKTMVRWIKEVFEEHQIYVTEYD